MLGSAYHQEPNYPCAGRVPPDPRYHSFTLTMWDRRIFAFPRIMVREPCLLFPFFLRFMPVLANDAQIICDNSGVISLLPWIFAAVKSAFGRNYECMGITCDAVGGYWRVLYRCCSLLRSAPGRYILLEYVPASSVTDHNALDLDQKAMEEQLADKTDASFAIAKNIYTMGAYSKPYARLTLSMGLPVEVSKGAQIDGTSKLLALVEGKAFTLLPAANTVIEVQYVTKSNQDIYVDCQVGGLPANLANTDGCFNATGVVQIAGIGAMAYSYDPLTENLNGRTLQGFSTQARDKMLECNPGCPQPEFVKFNNYYDATDYGNQWVLAAFMKTATSFNNFNIDFSVGDASDFAFRAEVIKKGTAYLNVYMYVIREFEDAIADCQLGCIDCNDDPVHAWDEGVAFYTGSSHGTEMNVANTGYFLYSLANKRCRNFKTCGMNGDELEGNSYINRELFKLFDQGRDELQNGQCNAARVTKDKIIPLMSVPTTQGTLRYAFITGNTGTRRDRRELQQGPLGLRGAKERGEGVIFAAAVVPIVAACNAADAQIIVDNMDVAATTTDFAAVKGAFERNYDCMGIKCSDVGGYYDGANSEYYAGADPCVDSVSPGQGPFTPGAPSPAPTPAPTIPTSSSTRYNVLSMPILLVFTMLAASSVVF
mmetsp:Transcript_27300/g.63391  ORF Transcript_27300/g.63391 Transcript_27300/m.63391 type:complete len:653 (+) Transcript_27300:846-2804(+)